SASSRQSRARRGPGTTATDESSSHLSATPCGSERASAALPHCERAAAGAEIMTTTQGNATHRTEPAAGSLQFKIHGMDCAEEVAVLKQAVGPVVGGESRLAFDILNGRMIVSRGADGPPSAA